MQLKTKMIQDTIDKVLRPYIIYINPDTPQDYKDELSKHGEVVENMAVELGKAIMVEREEIEKWKF